MGAAMFKTIALWLLIVGGLNWGLALFDFNLVSWLAEKTFDALEMIVYALVGIAALYIGYDELQG